MKILLVFPSRLDSHGRVKKYKKVLFMPLNLAIIDSLTPDRHQVTIVNDIAEEIDFNGPWDLVGITAMTAQSGRAYEIAARFRSRGIPVVMGGYHASLLPGDAAPHADAIVIGEAEPVWEQVLADAEAGALKPVYQALEPWDLSLARPPRWDHFNVSAYVRPFRAKAPEVPLFATRGCPFDCGFCSVTRFFGSSFRTRRISHVLDEIDASPSRQFFLIDDNIIGRPAYTRELFKALIPKQISWYTQLSSNIVKKPEILELAAKAGCHTAFVGIESLNRESLEGANKSFNHIETYTELFARLRSVGISPYVGIIFGFDQDTPEVFRQTLEFLRKNKVTMASFQIMTPFPGTPLFDQFEGEGRLLHKNWSLYDGSHMVIRHPVFSTEALLDGYWQTFQEFHSLPDLARRLSRPVRLDRNPALSLLVYALFLMHNRRLVLKRQHPLAGGVSRIS